MSRSLLSIAMIALLAASLLHSQSATSSLKGTVYDPNSLVVPGAKLVLTNVATNEKRSATTNGLGYYAFPVLPPSTYRIEVDAAGFKRFVRDNIQLDVASAATMNVDLQIGSNTDAITVTEQAPLLEGGSSSLGHVIENATIVNLPLNGRNSYSFEMLVPGVRGMTSSSGTGGLAYGMSDDQYVSINGSRVTANNFLLDGGANSEPLFNGPGFFTSVDTVQEYKVQTNNLSAEFSNTGGGVVNVITKSGTNALHGSLYEFLRNDKPDATNFFVNSSGGTKAPLRFNQFGGTVGGPVVHNRTFFFGSYEGLRWVRAMITSGTVPTDLQRAGDFSKTDFTNGQMITIYDPLAVQANPSTPGAFIRSVFPGNVIPVSRFDPVIKNVLNYIPHATSPGAQFTSANNFLVSNTFPTDKNEFTTRIDHAFTDNQKIFGRVSRNVTKVHRPPVYGTALAASSPDNGLDSLGETQVTINYTNVLGPRTVLELSSSGLHYHLDRTSAGVGFDTVQLGLPSYFHSLPGISCFGQWTATNMGVTNSVTDSGSGFLGSCGILNDSYDNFQEYGNLTMTRTAHTIKVGGNLIEKRLSTNRYSAQSPGFGFTQSFTQGPNPLVASSTAGVGFASMLLGTGSGSVTSQGPGQSIVFRAFGLYFQDDWKVSSKLTFNLGLRYDYTGPWTERYNRMTNFNFSSPSSFQGLQLLGGLWFPGTNGLPRGLFNTDPHNFGPRFGFSYSLNKNTVLRSGFGILYAPITGAGYNGPVASSGYLASTSWVGTLDSIHIANYASNPYPTGFLSATGSSLGFATLLGQSVNANDRDMHMPYTEQWNLNIQRTFPGNLLLDVAYAGSRGIHLDAALAADVMPNQYLSMQSALLQLVPNPYYGTITNGTLAAATVQENQLLRPYPQFTGVNLPWSSFGASTYHALEAKLERRFSGGLSFMASYTFSKSIDDVPLTYGLGGEGVSGSTYQDNNNRRKERTLTVWDVPQYLAMNGVWDLPFGTGRRYLHDNRLARIILGGWQVNSIVTLRSGVPLRLTTSSNTLNNYGGTQRPNWNGQDPNLPGSVSAKVNDYFNTTVFTQPAMYTFGNAPRAMSDLRGPGIANVDASLFRNIRLTEKVKLQFRGEVFNLANHPFFALPGTSIGSDDSGGDFHSAKSASRRAVRPEAALLDFQDLRRFARAGQWTCLHARTASTADSSDSRRVSRKRD